MRGVAGQLSIKEGSWRAGRENWLEIRWNGMQIAFGRKMTRTCTFSFALFVAGYGRQVSWHLLFLTKFYGSFILVGILPVATSRCSFSFRLV
jgi:hypothetical protein